ncbi:MAG TPA: hypothetical protein VIW94_09155, partial [Acidimicrobiia bacterium]
MTWNERGSSRLQVIAIGGLLVGGLAFSVYFFTRDEADVISVETTLTSMTTIPSPTSSTTPTTSA